MKSKSKINIKVKWTFNHSHSKVLITTVLIIIIYFIIYVDIVHMYTRVAKDIKIQLHIQLLKLYYSTTITKHAKKINQCTNTSLRAKEIYSKFGLRWSLNGPNQMFKWVMWAQIGRNKSLSEEVVSLRKELREGQIEDIEELLDQTECVGLRKVIITILARIEGNFLAKTPSPPHLMHYTNQACYINGWITPE